MRQRPHCSISVLVREDVLLESVWKDHQMVERERTCNQDRHTTSFGGRRIALPSRASIGPGGRLFAMSIAELYGRERPVFSFEFFPPKTDAGYESLYQTVTDLKRLNPDFVSVTWGAGGSTRRYRLLFV